MEEYVQFVFATSISSKDIIGAGVIILRCTIVHLSVFLYLLIYHVFSYIFLSSFLFFLAIGRTHTSSCLYV